MKYIIFSGIKPTGIITLGNYLGVIKLWKFYHKKYNYDCLFTIADLHAMTNINSCNYDIFSTKLLLDTLSLYLACGIDYKISTIFVQSQVNEHTKLNWILNAFTKVGELSNMIQFKKHKTNLSINYRNINNNAALLNYPILMAADILLYNTNYVIVGKDQKQHLELTKKIANRFNGYYKKTIFNIPLPIFSDYCYKIQSLTNPSIKMSKSSTNKNSYISILDSYYTVSQKIMSAVTDNDNPPKIYYDPIKKPGITNLLNILSGLTNIDIQHLVKTYYNYIYKDFKKVVIDNIYYHLTNIKKKYILYRKDEKFLKKIIFKGSVKASNRANYMINKILNK